MNGTMRRPRRMRRWILTGAVMASALLAIPLQSQLGAATPPSGTVGPSNATVEWAGPVYTMANVDPAACPPAAQDPLDLLCDHFTLTVDVAAGHWQNNTGGAEVAISWADSTNDFDLYVYDSAGTQVASSASGGTTSERAFIQSASGTYEVRVLPWAVAASAYDGSAAFVTQAGGPTPNPSRPVGGLTFSPAATVIDAQRTEGEPINWIDPLDGSYWESGPYGTSTANSFVHRSTDGGDQFNIVSPVGLRPDLPPGGGDTDVVTDDQGNAYFVDLEGLVNLGVAVSSDDGNTWRKNAVAVATTADDRQWFAVDNGPTAAAADNTVFLAYRQVPAGSFIYSTPGSTGALDPVGGLAYVDSSATPLPVSSGAPCGQLRFDPVKRNLYYPCAAGDHVEITVGHVDPGQRTGITYTNVQAPASPGGAVGDIFPAVAVDRAGNLYSVWVDEIDHNVYYAFSRNAGQTWSTVRQVNGNEANSNVFPWAQAGSDGTLVVAWYGSESHLDSDNMPSWYNDRQAASAYPWYGYASVIRNATATSPTYAQQRFTDQPMHYGQICNAGLACTTSDGDRTMADFFSVVLDRDGSLRFVFNDTTSQHHGAHLFEVRQVGGPGAFGGSIKAPLPKSPLNDPAGDAQTPHYFPVTGPGANLPQLDFTRLELSQPNASTLRVRMTLASLASLAPPAGQAGAVWLVRFQAPSVGDGGEEANRIFYLGAESVAGGTPTFFAGSGAAAQDVVPGNGCTVTTPENCKILQYPAEVAATGSISGNTITIDVPIDGGFGPDRPIFGDTLLNVTALSAGRSGVPAELYVDVDATRAIDYRLSVGTEPPTPGDGCRVNGGGAIAAEAGDARFTLNPSSELRGKVDYRDGTAASFRSTRLTEVSCDGATAHITGTGVSNGAQVTFTVDVVDGGEPGSADRFAITLSDGYAAEGSLVRGNVQVDGR